MSAYHRVFFSLLVPITFAAPAFAQEKKKPDTKEPKVMVVTPLAIPAGEKKTIRIRGLNLDTAQEIRFPHVTFLQPTTRPTTHPATLPTTSIARAPATQPIKSRGKAEAVKPLEATAVGDTQVEIDLIAPAPGPLSFSLISPQGASAAFTLQVVAKGSLIDEKEPNNGFRQAQELAPGKMIQAAINQPNDVDVFRFTAAANQTVIAKIRAADAGSPLDPLLTLYDSAGHVLAVSDDTSGDSKDPSLRHKVPTSGTYYLSIQDANDRGAALMMYLLELSLDSK